MKKYWQGKLALVTGASGGIGENIALYLAKQGCRIILVARRLDKLRSVAAKINNLGSQAFIYPADLTNPADRVSLHQRITSEVGVPDILINNAGIGWYGYFTEMPWQVARDVIELNITSVTHLTSLFLPEMLALPKARIINVGSISGKLPEQGIALYSASKAYLDAFTKSLYRELRGTKATVSVLRAGPVKTDFYDRAIRQPSGGQVPGELFAISADMVSRKIWYLIEQPSRYAYVPFYVFLSPMLEILFSWVLDLVGPILLRNTVKKAAR